VYERYQGLGRYGTLGIEIVLSILFGYWVGHWADGKLGTHGWLSVVGFVLGVAAAVRAVVTTAKRLKRDMEKEDEDGR
jgi:F0F1-type ATP synthase assembly protein I